MLMDLDDLDDVRRAWIEQIIDDKMTNLVALQGDGQIEVRLYANKGRVRKDPVVLLNSGPGSLG